ncbi:hypothetical protein [Desulfobotulus sp.]|uniref:hypothetical protein n=1 Tax=Desulfobotulus sp. TaxID=1940337 RepID=UPI002A360359|nr:hypothetical protein [Desulfobotulus sp.]MDY0164308.1 hypothetical protein [Desulfobotulus sp.]
MEKHTWKTARGGEVTIEIIREEAMIAKATRTKKTLGIEIRFGKEVCSNPRLEDGFFNCGIIRMGGKSVKALIPTNPDALAVFEKYQAELGANHKRSKANEKEYADHRSNMKKIMGY